MYIGTNDNNYDSKNNNDNQEEEDDDDHDGEDDEYGHKPTPSIPILVDDGLSEPDPTWRTTGRCSVSGWTIPATQSRCSLAVSRCCSWRSGSSPSDTGSHAWTSWSVTLATHTRCL